MTSTAKLDRFEQVARAAVNALAEELPSATQVLVIVSDPIVASTPAPAFVMACSRGVSRGQAALMLASALTHLEDETA